MLSPRTLLLDIALTHLSGRKRQTFVSVIGVAMGVGFFIAMAAMMQGFQSFFVQTVLDVSPHITMHDDYREPPRQPLDRLLEGVPSASRIEGVKPKEEIRGIRSGERIAAALSRQPGLSVSPMLEGQIFFRYGSTDVSSSLLGIDPEREARITRIERDMVEGSLRNLMTYSNGVILGSGIASKLGVERGDTLSAISPAGVVQKMKVVGIFHTGIVAMDDGIAYALLKRVQILQNRPNVVNSLRFRLSDPDTAPDLARRFETLYSYKSESWQEANQGFMSIFVVQNTIMYSTTGAILIVACFGIFNVISTIVNEKTKDIAILKSMGFTEGDIRRIFLWQGIMVGLAGMILGWALGYGLSRGLASVEITVKAMISSDHLFIVYSIWHYVIGGIACTVAATLAAWLPARKAASLNPVEIVRGAA